MKSRQISGGILCDLSKARINICRKKHAVGFWCKTDVYLACCMTCRLSFPSGCSTLISYSVVYAFSGLVGQWDDNILDYSTTYRTTYDCRALFVFVRPEIWKSATWLSGPGSHSKAVVRPNSNYSVTGVGNVNLSIIISDLWDSVIMYISRNFSIVEPNVRLCHLLFSVLYKIYQSRSS